MSEDKDIKIYVGKGEVEAIEFDSISQDIQRQIANGNSDKAREIGEIMAQYKPDETLLSLSRFNFSAAELYQIRVLLNFVAVYSVNQTIANEFISNMITSSMYEYLKKNENAYFRNISDGSAFTFYRLAVNKGGDIAEDIGAEFAKRCGIRKAEIESFGAKAFNFALEKFTELLKEANFEE